MLQPALTAINPGSWQLLVILVGVRQEAEGRRQKEERYNWDTSNFVPSNIRGISLKLDYVGANSLITRFNKPETGELVCWRDKTQIKLIVSAIRAVVNCPVCNQPTHRIHSRYERKARRLALGWLQHYFTVTGTEVFLHQYLLRLANINAPACKQENFWLTGKCK